MNVMKSLWASVQGDPVFMRKFNGWLTLVWVAMMPIAVMAGWIYLTAFVAVVSIYANATGHLSAWQASRVEVKQDEQSE